MKELFCKLIEPTQKNEISMLSTFKLWVIILLSYWMLVGGLTGIGVFFTYIASKFEIRLLFIIIHILSSLTSVAYALIVFVILHLVSAQSKIFFKLTSFISLTFSSVPQMFVFSLVILSFIVFFSSLGGVVIGLWGQNNLNLSNAYWMLTHPLFLTCCIAIFQFLVSCVGFIALKIVLELGLCGACVKETQEEEMTKSAIGAI